MGTKRVVRVEDEIRIGAAIRDARIIAEVTQANLALAIGVTYQQVQNYEKGNGRIAASTLKAVAEFLAVPIASLFDTKPRIGRVVHEGLNS